MDLDLDSQEQPAVQLRTQRQRVWGTFTRNRTALIGLVLVILIALAAIFADDWFIAMVQGREARPLLAPHSYSKQDPANRLQPPSAEHPMGLDTYGRDVLSRIIHGTRVSLMVGLISVLLAGGVGTFLGLLAGYTGGKVEDVIMRSVDVLMAFPSLIMGVMVLAIPWDRFAWLPILRQGLTKMIIAIGIMLSPAFVRIVHSTTLSIKENDYVMAAQSIGVSSLRMIRTHILPNVMGEAVVLASVYIATAIRVEANLSFIGLGVSPPTPAWGSMIRDGTQYLTIAPWISIFPGLAILITVLAFNLVGDGLRDIMDPRSYE
jgi:peptide/nickel transport system permease protein